MPGNARMLDREPALDDRLGSFRRMTASPALMRWGALSVLVLAACLLAAPKARADGCPPIADKPGAIPHVDYDGVQHLTYCYGPVTVTPGQNLIRIHGTDLLPREPGYITRFDPELVYPDGTVPRVDVLHLHHAVWLVNLRPQFAVGEEKTIIQMPQGFGWFSVPADRWLLNDMLHDLTGQAADVYIVWRIDFVPSSSPAAASIHRVNTQWMDVSGMKFYPVFDALRRFGNHRGRYTFPDQTHGPQRGRIGFAQKWFVQRPETLISTVGHLHPGGLKTTLRVDRNGQSNVLFRSWAHYYEPAGAVSWDVAMTASPPDWRVTVQPGDVVSVHATYDVSKADWYEVMGIMPIAVYDGTDVGGVDAFSGQIPQNGILTHTHLAENWHHGGHRTRLPDPRFLRNGPNPFGPIGIENFTYERGALGATGSAVRPPTIKVGQRLTFQNLDAGRYTFHTITACRAPCNRSTGLAYPIANGPVSFDSGELGYNNYSAYAPLFGGPASDRDRWKTPRIYKPGTYTFFCRIHPFMRGSFRVIDPKANKRNKKHHRHKRHGR
jgi:plastocyanin